MNLVTGLKILEARGLDDSCLYAYDDKIMFDFDIHTLPMSEVLELEKLGFVVDFESEELVFYV